MTKHAVHYLSMVYVVNDDLSIRRCLSALFQSVGLGVMTFGSATEFLRGERLSLPCCLILDDRIPGTTGLELQAELKKPNRIYFGLC